MSSQNFDIQKLHLSSKPVQMLAAIILAVLIVVAAYFASFQSQMETLQTAEDTETELKGKYEKLAVKVANLENLRAELVLIEDSISTLIKQLPTDAEIPNLIQELHQAAASNNLTLNHLIPRKALSEDANIQRLPFSVSVTGSYEQLANFARDVGHVSRIVTLSSINIAPEDDKNNKPDSTKPAKPANRFVLTAVASTYKAVDTDLPAASAASGAASAAAQ
ncbi:type 4a pilus biogenesis protein PilO [Simonsiella muelleri]|uniref:type 4a pilus biogenesis protein PilO n=2 Tax=Simonsiella muelleri TaxID=72 RepID=UPI0028D47806|nr:type 4a pilus biogenesis protein PilO [Simonsiella muelleri]